MRYRIFLFHIIFISTFLASCFKKEIAVQKHNAGNVITRQVDLASNYKEQIYFNLRTGKVVSQNSKTDWDLGFESSKDGYHVILNSSCSMFALNTGSSDFNASFDTTGLRQYDKCDKPEGFMDSTAIGDWRTTTPVFLIDRGYNEYSKIRGIIKCQILNVSDTSYDLRVANIDGSMDRKIHIRKNDTYNFQFISFDEGKSIVEIEPPKTDWDIVFTQYTTVFYDYQPPMPYMVVGCLLNRYHTKATKDSLIAFDKINFEFAQKQNLSPAINSIGYDWKIFEQNIYTTHSYMNFTIQCQDGSLYKMHFIDFYSDNGVKGVPKWEYQAL